MRRLFLRCTCAVSFHWSARLVLVLTLWPATPLWGSDSCQSRNQSRQSSHWPHAVPTNILSDASSCPTCVKWDCEWTTGERNLTRQHWLLKSSNKARHVASLPMSQLLHHLQLLFVFLEGSLHVIKLHCCGNRLCLDEQATKSTFAVVQNGFHDLLLLASSSSAMWRASKYAVLHVDGELKEAYRIVF